MKTLLLIFALAVSVAMGQQKPLVQEGIASFYADKLVGSTTAHGEQYDAEVNTAAHSKLPLHSMVRVTNLENNKSVVVRINDRLPESSTKAILISKNAATEIGMVSRGSVKVHIEEVIEEPEEKPNAAVAGQGLMEAKMSGNATYDCEGSQRNPKGYTVQVAALSNLKAFRDVCEELVKKGNDRDRIFIQVSENEKGKIFRVVVGAYEKEEWAREKLKMLTEAGYKAVVKNHLSSTSMASLGR